jgi:hypothetical protein
LAHQLYADAVLIDIDVGNLAQAEVDKQAAIEAGANMVLEATFRAGQYRVSSDVVQRQTDGSWHLIEVKSSTAPKSEHIPDLAFQSYVMQRSGYRVSRCSVLHANTAGHPADYELPTAVRIMVDRMQQQRIDINPAPIWKMLDALRYPLYFLDFESIAIATPLFEDSSPSQKYAFQYSLHVQSADGEISHFEYLHEQRSDPGEMLARSLLDHTGPTGSVIVYNKTMERGVLNALARQFAEMGDGLRQISSRIWDLEVVFRKHYRHWQWGTKSSIKNVLPSLVPELSYKGLEVKEAGMASLEWLRMIETGDVHRKAAIATALRRYCALDTLAMVRLLEVVEKETATIQAG